MSIISKTIFLLLCLFSTFTHAVDVYVLDVDAALRASDEAKIFSESLSSHFKNEEMRLRELDAQSKALTNQMENKQGARSEAELDRLKLQFQKVISELQNQSKVLQQLRLNKEQEFLKGFKPKMDRAIKTLIDESDIKIIINRQATIYVDSGLDITADVVKKLNELK